MDEQYMKFMEMIRMAYTASGIPVTHPEPVYREEKVPGENGEKLFTYCYFPEEEGIFPVVVQRHPYAHMGMDIVNKIAGEEFAKRGYIYVCQHCRGTGNSEGEWEPNVHERADGITLINWVAEQPWCGNIGIMGDSYLSLVGWSVADIVPDKVKSMYLGNYGVDRFTSMYKDGMIRHDIITSWTMENAGFKIDADYLETCRFRPHIEVDEKLWGQRIEWYREYLRNADRSTPFWAEGVWKELSDIPSKMKIPVYVTDNWYDHHLGSAIYSFEHLSEQSKSHSTFCVGGLNHFSQPCLQDREVKQAGLNGAAEELNWFEATLKREELPPARIRTYLINRDIWQEWESWPVPADQKVELQFSARKDGNAYGLSENPVQGEAGFIYDPENPVLSHGAESMLHTKEAIGSLLQPEAGWRDDVISFVSEPLKKEQEILGKIKVKLYVSTDAEDTAFTAKVMEVMPDGKAYNIRSTIATISAQHESYTPGEIVALELDMWEINWMLNEGSRLRIDISSSDFPQYSIHSNFKGPWYEQVETKKAAQHIWCGEGTPSAVEIPIYTGK